MKGKITGLFFSFLLCVITVNGFCQEEKYLPLTWEIFTDVQDKHKDYFISKSFSIKINVKNNANAFDSDGMFVSRGENPSPKLIDFFYDEAGKLFSNFDVPKGREVLGINFPDTTDADKKNIMLNFMRNTNKNRFELVSAVIDTVNYTFRFTGELPFLTVKTTIDLPGYELQAVPISEGRNYPSQSRHENPNPAVRSNAGHDTGNRYGAIYIDAPGSLNKSAVIEFIKHKNHYVSPRYIENLVETYFWAAGREGINTDLAIAQMCKTTNFLGIERIMQTHNYAGFASTPKWPGRFYGGMKEGVIAHIQHLKGYTSNVRRSELKEPLADPRWDMIDGFRGTIHTLEDLSKKWAPYNSIGYENDIKEIINAMRRFSSRGDT